MTDVTPTPPPSVAAEQQQQQAIAYGLIGATGALSLIVCGLRLWIRASMLKRFGSDDIAVVVALVITQAFNGIGLAVVYYGCGKHIEYVSEQDLAIWLKLYYAAMCLYLYIAMFVKISLLLFQRRLFPNPWLQKLTLGLIVFLVLFSISGSLVLAFQCKPARAAFDLTLQATATCLSRFTLFQITLYQAVLMFCTDIIILIAPIPILLKLNMPGHKIIPLIAIFGTGIIACIAPIVRFSTLDYLLDGSTDLTYDANSSLYWMAIEFNLSLVAGSLSSLRPLGVFRVFGSSAERSKYPTYGRPHNSNEEWVKMDGSNKSGTKKFKGHVREYPASTDTEILQATANESQEHIIENGKPITGI